MGSPKWRRKPLAFQLLDESLGTLHKEEMRKKEMQAQEKIKSD